MSNHIHYSENHIFTSRSNNSVVTLKAGANETLLVEGSISGDIPLISGKYLIGNVSNIGEGQTLSGDLTSSNVGVITLANTGVTPGSYNYSNITVDSKGRLTSAATPTQIFLPNGTVVDPSYSFSSNANAGLYHIGSGSGSVNMSVDGIRVMYWLYDSIKMLMPVHGIQGTQAAPSYSFNTETTSGMFLPVAGSLKFSVAGTSALQLTATAINPLLPITGYETTSLTNDYIRIGSGGLSTAVPVGGDLTMAYMTGTAVTTLATVNANIGSFGSASHTGSFTVNAKGLITSAANVIITGFSPSTLNNSYIFVGNVSSVATGVAMSGDLTISNSGVTTLATVATAGTYAIPTSIVLDVKGRTTSITSALTAGNIIVGNVSNVATSTAMSGDATISNSGVLTLANSGVTAATYSYFPTIAIDAKGRITSASSLATAANSVMITSALSVPSFSTTLPTAVQTNITELPLTNTRIYVGNASNIATGVALSGDATISNVGVLTLANTAVSAASYSYANITVDSKGRLTSASTPTVFQLGGGSATAPPYSFTSDANCGIWSSAADNLDFTTNGVNRLNISATALTATKPVIIPTGAVGAPTIGFTADTTTGIFSSTTSRVSVAIGGINYVECRGDNPLDITAGTGSTNIINIRFRNSAGTAAGSISTAVAGTTTAYTTASDRRLKTNIGEYTTGLEKLMKLEPVEYEWICNGKTSNGFIAQELKEIFPEAVTGSEDALNDDGTPDYMGIDTSFLVASLVQAVQELKREIDELKRKLT